MWAEEPSADIMAEEDSRAVEEVPDVADLGNKTVLLHFYEEPPQEDNCDFQTAAVFELLSLGLSALFQVVVDELWKVGRTRPAELATRIAGDKQLGQFWPCRWLMCVARPKARFSFNSYWLRMTRSAVRRLAASCWPASWWTPRWLPSQVPFRGLPRLC